MIVVDADVCAYFWIGEPPDRLHLAEEVRRRDADWRAPVLWRSEFRNVLATYLKAGRMDLATVTAFASRARLDMIQRELEVESSDVLRLVEQSGQTAYDCEFVAAAKSIGVQLVTGDRSLAAAFPETAVTMEDFVAG